MNKKYSCVPFIKWGPVCVFVLVTAVIGLSVLLTRFAYADEDSYLKEAQRFYRNGDYQQAVEICKHGINEINEFKAYYSISDLYFWMGASYIGLGDEESAKDAFKKALEYNPTFSVDPNQFPPNIVAEVNEIRAEMKGKLTIQCKPVNCNVIIDGINSGTTPFSKDFPIGERSITLIPVDNKYHSWSGNKTIWYKKETVFIQSLNPITGHIKLDGSPKGANVYVNGNEIGSLPYEGDIIIGYNEIRISKDGYEPWKKNVVINQGEHISFNVSLTPKPTLVNINTNPNKADVYINGSKSGMTPITLQISSGVEYNIKLSKSGYLSIYKKLRGEPGENYNISEELSRIYNMGIEAGLWVPTGSITIFPIGYGLEFEAKPWAESRFQSNPIIGLHVGLGFWYTKGSGNGINSASLYLIYVPLELRIPNDTVLCVYAAGEPYYYSGSASMNGLTSIRKSINNINIMPEVGVRLNAGSFIAKLGYSIQQDIGGIIFTIGGRL